MREMEGQQNIVQVVTESRNLSTQPFSIPDDPKVVGKAWEEWIEDIERQF